MKELIKKIIFIVGIVSLLIVFILNIFVTGDMGINEWVKVKPNSIAFIFSSVLVAIAVYLFGKFLDKKLVKGKYIFYGLLIIVYIGVNIFYINVKDNRSPVYDQLTVYRLAIAMNEDKLDDIASEENAIVDEAENGPYFERYQQQLTLAFVWKILFKMFNNTNYIIIRYFNLLGNILILSSIMLICKELSKKYKVNLYLGFLMFFTFLSLIYLVTFVYGDTPGLGFSMIGVYFIMKYVSERKIKFALLSSLSMSIAYLLRMNYVIFVVAILIYMFLDLIDKNNYKKGQISKETNNEEKVGIYKRNKENINKIITKIIVMIVFLGIVLVPSNIIKTYYCNKMGLDKNKSFILTGYFYMGMSEAKYSPRMV